MNTIQYFTIAKIKLKLNTKPNCKVILGYH